MYYYARTHKAAQTGSTIKSVTCEKCGVAFAYRLVRRGEGSGTAPYGLGNEAAKLRAQRQATQTLKKRLENGIDPVACPDCGWMQEEMVRELRRRRYRWLNMTALVLGLLFGLALLLWWTISTKGNRSMKPGDRDAVSVLAGLLAIGLAGPPALRRFLQQLLDPNRHYPAPPDPIPGAPKGFKPGENISTLEEMPPDAAQSGLPSLEYARRPPELEPGGWITVQLLNVPLPTQCCSCMTETQNVFTFKPRDLVSVPVRICNECRARNRTRWWLWIGASTLLTGLVVFLLTWGLDLKTDQRLAIAVPITIIGLLIGVYMGRRVTAPVKFGGFDSTLNTLRIRFRNPNYAQTFIAAQSATGNPQLHPGFSIPLPRPQR